jgi:hypothetical protein
VVDLDIAKVLVVFLLALGQLRFAKADVGRLGAELEAVAIQVVAIGYPASRRPGWMKVGYPAGRRRRRAGPGSITAGITNGAWQSRISKVRA